jgi:uncharacterized protein DUF4166
LRGDPDSGAARRALGQDAGSGTARALGPSLHLDRAARGPPVPIRDTDCPDVRAAEAGPPLRRDDDLEHGARLHRHYLGTHQHLAVDLHASVDEEGGVRFRSGEQRFYEGPIAFRFPMLLSGIAEVREWYEDDERRFRISVDVRNRRFGRLFGYRGWFHAEERPCAADEVPDRVKPVREERRE